MNDIADAASLLFRLDLEGVGVGNRWRKLVPLVSSHIDDHVLGMLATGEEKTR